MTEQCCTELSDCGTDCSALIDCLGNCKQGDTACQQQCGKDHPAGISPFQALAKCFQGSCQNDMRCGSSQQFEICNSGIALSGTKAEACATCLSTNCCTEFTACGNDTDKSCLNCLKNPAGAGCSTDTEANAVNTCVDTKCAMDCQ